MSSIHFVKPFDAAQSTASWATTVRLFQASGLPANLLVCPRWRLFPRGYFPWADHLGLRFERWQNRCLVRQFLDRFPKDGVCWLNSVPLRDETLEHGVKQRGGKFIFNLLDDWLSIDAAREVALRKIALADLVVVPTDELRAVVAAEVPGKAVAVCEEVVDCRRLRPGPRAPHPRIVWCGRPNNLHYLEPLREALANAFAVVPFEFVILGGTQRPSLNLGIPFRWIRFSQRNQHRWLSGSTLGLAPLGHTRFDSCKGNYKVKTYLAMGVPVAASPLGINTRLISPGQNGFLPTSPSEWTAAILSSIRDPATQMAMSAQARSTAEQNASHEALIPQWISTLARHGLP